jgi:hypothetical protein
LFFWTSYEDEKTMAKEKVTFEKNVPTEVELAYPIGRRVAGRYGESLMLFLPLPVAARIEALNPKAGDVLGICKRAVRSGDGKLKVK